jgi:hypothetical protein
MKICGLALAAVALTLPCRAWAGGKKTGDEKPEEKIELQVNDQLVNADLKDKVRSECFSKIFTFKMMAGKTYQIDMVSAEIDPYLRLENSQGAALDENRKGGGKGNARLLYRAPKTDDYDIIATSTNPGMGKFTLTVKELKGVGKPIELVNDKGNANYVGKLTGIDAVYKGKKHKLFLFNMEAGKTYQIDMISKAFDAYLYLENPDGVQLAEDDDGGGNLNARIVYKAAVTGTHRIVATYYAANFLGGAGGDFTLTIRQLDK